MFEALLKKRDFPLIVLLGIPQTILDLIGFIVLLSYFYVRFELHSPVIVDVIYIVYFIIVYYTIKKNTDNDKYRMSLDLSRNGVALFIGVFLGHIFG